jgi:phage terminase small subunit
VSRRTHNPRPLSPRAKLYIAEYLRSLNGAKAAVAAGYSKAAAVDISKQLQNNPLVREAVNQGIAEREQEIRDKAVKALEHAYCQATADVRDMFDEEGKFLDVHKMPRRIRWAIASIEVEEIFAGRGEERSQVGVLRKVKIHDKRASQELIVKFAGKLKDRMEVDMPGLEKAVLEAERLRREREEKRAAEAATK